MTEKARTEAEGSAAMKVVSEGEFRVLWWTELLGAVVGLIYLAFTVWEACR